MIKTQRGYRGVDFGIEEFGPRKWAWTILSKTKSGVLQRGEINGSLDDAVMSCRKTIDALLDGIGPN